MPRNIPRPLQRQAFMVRAHRNASLCKIEISGPTVGAFRTTLHNISSSGMLVDHFGLLTVDDIIIATLPGLGAVMGRVVRLKRASAGVKFQTSIDLERYRAAIAQAGPAAG
ncbi:PilZ domain-containing protein [Sphingobium aquiterrae]|uniref:PilZ domain-containing protein n=1 Tax=Sphingobium aquiterrae TaxID=2038656 RepID=UPI0030181657